MEHKIGEIFEYNGEWYQCVEGTCRNCSFYYDAVCKNITTIGNCYYSSRTDHKFVIFKKLEKVGEPYERYIGSNKSIKVQRYRLPYRYAILPKEPFMILEPNYKNSIEIEIKQTKEDMEDLDKIKVRDYTKVEELNVMEENKLNLKPFDIQKAREGKPVCTRDGRKARIICFDRIDAKPILALVPSTDGKGEDVFDYFISGKRIANALESDLDLMMLPEKKEGWVNVYNSLGVITFSHNPYDTKEEALASEMESPVLNKYYVDTVKVEWEE